MSSGYADEHSKFACAVHSLSTTLVCTPLPRGPSFFAAPKKEGKKGAFQSGVALSCPPASALAEVAPQGSLAIAAWCDSGSRSREALDTLIAGHFVALWC